MTAAKPIRTGDGLLKQIRAEIQARTDTVTRGVPHEEYLKLVGAITGLRVAEQFIADLLEHVHDDNEFAP